MTLYDDDDDIFLDREMSKDQTPTAKRHQSRRRSISITPPPPVPEQQLRNARELVKCVFIRLGSQRIEFYFLSSQALEIKPRSASPVFIEEDSNNDIELAPELASIAADMKKKDKQQTSRFDHETTSNTREVKIRIKFMPHPEDDTGVTQVYGMDMRQVSNSNYVSRGRYIHET